MSPLLIVAATRPELAELTGRLEDREDTPLPFGNGFAGTLAQVPVSLAWFGVGKSSTAAGLALAVQRLRPDAVVQIGIGGAFEGAGLEVGGAAVASSEVHLDLGVYGEDDSFSGLEELGLLTLEGPAPLHNEVPVDEALATALAGGAVPLLPFGTAETVTGTRSSARRSFGRSGVAVESMEGAAAAQTCFALGVPFAELRGISNIVGERDKAKWDVPAALTAAHAVLSDWLEKGAPHSAISGRVRR